MQDSYSEGNAVKSHFATGPDFGSSVTCNDILSNSNTDLIITMNLVFFKKKKKKLDENFSKIANILLGAFFTNPAETVQYMVLYAFMQTIKLYFNKLYQQNGYSVCLNDLIIKIIYVTKKHRTKRRIINKLKFIQ